MVDAGNPIMGKGTDVLVDGALGELLRKAGAVDVEGGLLPAGHVPAGEQKTGIVDVVVEVMVREKQVVDVRR